MFGRKKQAARLPAVQIRSIEIPSVEIGGGRLPHIRTPELHTPEIRTPEIEIPSIDIGGGRLPQIRTPELRTPQLTIPQLDLSTAAPFVRVRRKNPVVQVLKFVVGAGLGLAVGVVIAAMLTPYAGEDTRRKLRDLAKGGPKALMSGGDQGATQSFPIGTGEVQEGIAGLLSNPKGRFELAKEEAQKAREAKERELQAEFQTAKRTGSAPD
jgi:hypothetical protein